ncbi:MAG: hypothetical protein JWL60_597 [Gemmatimonadetes bacterium]|jgi:hypothetical protein|nr:hypothetical protein [Gemmatimonadota bacterium]
MLQVTLRTWPAEAVHDTVAAVMRTPPFQRSVQRTLLDRLLGWLAQGLDWLGRQLGGVPSGRTVVIWLTAIVALALLVRLLLSAQARGAQGHAGAAGRRIRAGEDPWRAADRLAAEGDHEGAVHALYRGVLAALAARDGLRLDPAKTSGDYLRELRARGSPSHQPFRAFARRFDAAVYGYGVIDAALVADLRALALPMRAEARAA